MQDILKLENDIALKDLNCRYFLAIYSQLHQIFKDICMLSLASYCEKSLLLFSTKSFIFYFLLIEQRYRFSRMWHQFIHLISFPILKIFVHITDEYTEMMYWNNHQYIPRKDSEWGEEEEEVVARAWVCHCFWAFRTCCISSGTYCFHMYVLPSI